MIGKAIAKISIEEYLKMELKAEVRHEYHNGEVFAMAGGTINHSVLGTNITSELHFLGKSNGCNTFNGDMKIRLEESNRFLYPEVSVVCGKVETSPNDPNSITNPILVAEVLSDSSEAYDRGKKFELYRQLPSFKEYILIDQHRPVVSIFFRKGDNVWEMRGIYGLEEKVYLQSLDADISMADLYRNTKNLLDPMDFSEDLPEE